MIDLIYCGAGNKRFADIAIEAGWRFGAQMPNTIYHPPYFIDQDWKNPRREAYMAALATHRPHIATVLDWEHEEQLPEVLDWAEEATQYADVVVIVPKVQGGIARLPRTINSKEVRLGYSVPTRYAGTELFISAFVDWPIHLLGGAPRKQMGIASYLPHTMSADCNMMLKMATRFCAFWSQCRIPGSKHHPWPTLAEVEDTHSHGAPERAFRRSCVNIMNAWVQAFG